MDKNTIRAAIFDMDGVIVDSEIVYNDYLLEFATLTVNFVTTKVY